MNRFLPMAAAAKMLAISPQTLRRWERAGVIAPIRTPGGHRRYSSETLAALMPQGLPTTKEPPK